MRNLALVLLAFCGSFVGRFAQTEAPAHPKPPVVKSEKAPLPDKVVTARRVFLINQTGERKLFDAVYRRLKSWGRWEVVTDREVSDLVLAVSNEGAIFGQDWYLRVSDPKTGEQLWTVHATGGMKLWRTWDAIAKDLLADIQKRLK